MPGPFPVSENLVTDVGIEMVSDCGYSPASKIKASPFDIDANAVEIALLVPGEIVVVAISFSP